MGIVVLLVAASMAAAGSSATPNPVNSRRVAPCIFNTSTNCAELHGQCLALCDFYQATGGDGWESGNDFWDWGKSDLCSPKGVHCDSTGTLVTFLDVSISGLVGTIPSSITSLVALTSLNLHGNSLSGTLPHQLSNLTKLGRLKLDKNRFSGIISSQLAKLTGLVSWPVHNNLLSGSIPSEISRLTKLGTLDWYNNRLSGSLSPQLSSLTALAAIRVYQNRLSGSLPPELSSLEGLTRLRVETNSLSGGIPEHLSGLTRLRFLQLDHNRLSGSIPQGITSLTNLRLMQLHRNSLSGALPDGIGRMTSLRVLTLSECAISGGIPESLSSLTSLETVQAYSNAISGTLSEQLSLLTALEHITFGRNALSGTLPPGLEALTSLVILHLGQNRISGSCSTRFGNWTFLRLLSLFENANLECDLSLINRWPSIQRVLLQDCALRGELPELFVAHDLDTLLLHGNSLSGTMTPSLFANAAFLRTVTLSGNRLSGSLPVSLGSLPRLKSLLADNMRLEGTIPEGIIVNREQFAAQMPVFQSPFCPVEPSGTCVTSYDYPRTYGFGSNCLLRVLAPGYLTAEVFNTEWLARQDNRGSVMTITTGSQSREFSGVTGPVGEYVANGSTVAFKVNAMRRDLEATYRWRLCWSGTPPRGLQTLSLARNALVGNTDALANGDSLRTLALASNMFECDAVRLNNAQLLATGHFKDPGPEALYITGREIRTIAPGVNPFEYLDARSYPNIALTYPGNVGLTTSAAYLSDADPGNLLERDRVRKGQLALFPGQSAFQQFVYLILPGLVVLHVAVVAVVTWTYHEKVVRYMRRALPRAEQSTRAKVVTATLNGLYGLAFCGVALVVLNLCSDAIYRDCTDYLLRTTIAQTVVSTTYQWAWVLLNVVSIGCLAFLRYQIWQVQSSRRAHAVYSCLYDVTTTPQGAAIRHWVSKIYSHRASAWRELAYWALHIPLAMLASAPAFGFVVAKNVRSDSWVLQFAGSTAVLAVVKLSWSAHLLPSLTRILARVRHGVRAHQLLSPSIAIRLYKSQVGSMLISELVALILAPMLSTLLLDESCLRYYLMLDGGLRSLFEAWGIAQDGYEAYRPGYCTRRLLSEFVYVWLTMVLISGLFTPSFELLRSLGWHRRAQSYWVGDADGTSAAPVDMYEATLNRATEVQQEVLNILTFILLIELFGGLVPVLLLLAPIVSWVKLCAWDCIERHSGNGESWGEVVASNIIVQVPVTLLHRLLRVGTWLVAAFIFVDLQFDVGPILVYTAVSLLETIFTECLHAPQNKLLSKNSLVVVDFAQVSSVSFRGLPPAPSEISFTPIPREETTREPSKSMDSGRHRSKMHVPQGGRTQGKSETVGFVHPDFSVPDVLDFGSKDHRE
eukprot:TRINITY_DN9049_c0_g1_i1.p1 TRINITY_DN9049_c0_g1~~TRINITY_DN9049_c0_g1_i1.p1  ORF type:complete len:1372 (-),score=167.80 TRINITY_DN9049_c0_g1_i1:1954-6069(-)